MNLMEVLGKRPGEKDKAEQLVYDYLQSVNIDGKAYFNLDLNQTPEIDTILWVREAGFFIMETKGFYLDDFHSISLDQIKYVKKVHQNRYGNKPPPWKQASNNARVLSASLNEFYRKKQIFSELSEEDRRRYKSKNVPFVFSFPFFPYISRESFVARFPGYARLNSDFILFNDVLKNEKMFSERLTYIARNQLLKHVLKSIEESNKQMDIAEKRVSEKMLRVASCYNVDTIAEYDKVVFRFKPEEPTISRYDENRLKLLESTRISEDVKDVNYAKLIYRGGYAGTGKTLIGLRILKNIAGQEEPVLYCAFNKVLATDIRRLTRLSESESYAFLRQVTFSDIHSLISDYFDTSTMGNIDSIRRFDDRFDNIVTQIMASGDFKGIFAKIVIDEAQDFPEYGWRLLEFLGRDGTDSFVILDGVEQRLYAAAESLTLKKLKAAANNLKAKNAGNFRMKKRVFRNSQNAFLFAQSFYEFFPNRQNALDFIRAYQANRDGVFEFDMESGRFPYIITAKNIYSTLVKAIEKLIGEANKHALGHAGLLIMIPYPPSKINKNHNFYHDLVCRALQELNIDYMNYADPMNRRLSYSDTQVRVATFHSARGIESNFSILLGFEEIQSLSHDLKIDYKVPAYISLSRAKYDTYIISQKKNDFMNAFIEYSRELYEEFLPNDQFIYDNL